MASHPHESVKDGLLTLYVDLPKDRERIRQIKDPTAKAAMFELEGTALSYTHELAAYVLQMRQWATEAFVDVDRRLGALEAVVNEVESGLSDEEAQKIIRLCEECAALVQHNLDLSPTADEEAKQRLRGLMELSNEVLAFLSEEEPGDSDGDAAQPTEQ